MPCFSQLGMIFLTDLSMWFLFRQIFSLPFLSGQKNWILSHESKIYLTVMNMPWNCFLVMKSYVTAWGSISSGSC